MGMTPGQVRRAAAFDALAAAVGAEARGGNGQEAASIAIGLLSHLRASGWDIVPGWRPIETAPREPLNDSLQQGPLVELFVLPLIQQLQVGFWDAGGDVWCTADGHVVRPSHWRPLSSPPSALPGA